MTLARDGDQRGCSVGLVALGFRVAEIQAYTTDSSVQVHRDGKRC